MKQLFIFHFGPFQGNVSSEPFSVRSENKKNQRMIFNVVVTPDPEDGGFSVSCPALPGCHSQGETIEEALENIRDAISGCVDVLTKRTDDL